MLMQYHDLVSLNISLHKLSIIETLLIEYQI